MGKHLAGYEDIKVLGARVVIRVEKEDKVTPSGIIIAKEKEDPKYEGVVVVTGDGARLENGVRMPMDVEPGDRVIYSRLAGVPIKHKGEELLVINERDVVAIIGKEK